MGPSILAAFFTTIAAATIMLFTIITFFVKFAVILFFTVLQATVGSFIVFLVLADTFGPSHPTFVVDWISDKVCGSKKVEGDGNSEKVRDGEVDHVGEGRGEENGSSQVKHADVEANDVEEGSVGENVEDGDGENCEKKSDSQIDLLNT